MKILSSTFSGVLFSKNKAISDYIEAKSLIKLYKLAQKQILGHYREEYKQGEKFYLVEIIRTERRALDSKHVLVKGILKRKRKKLSKTDIEHLKILKSGCFKKNPRD